MTEPALAKYIETRDKRLKERGYIGFPISEAFASLLKNGAVTVGGRTSCGGKVDPTWVMFTAWNEVVKKAQGLGYVINRENVKHGNGWATKNGGFWNEAVYTLKETT